MMNDTEEEEVNRERFFTEKPDEKKDDARSLSLEGSTGSDEEAGSRCWTLRILQHLLPCLQKKGVWAPSQGDVFKTHDAGESKYPRSLKILENPFLDFIFFFSCLLSIYLSLFSEGFLVESRLLWGIIHLVNAVYAFGLFCQWLQILIRSKYAKNNHGYTTMDIIYTLLSVFPADLVIISIYSLNDKNDYDDNKNPNPISVYMISYSRLNYFLRIRTIMQYFSKWEDHLVIGDFKMFLIRTSFFATFLIHLFACIWHRIACNGFKHLHLKMTPDQATVEVCYETSWIGQLKLNHPIPLLETKGTSNNSNVLVDHYFVSVYWTIISTFRLGASDIRVSLGRNVEVAFVCFVEITAWIYILTLVNGTLASLFIEEDTERQNFLTRVFAIRHFMKQFGDIGKSIQDDVTKFYNYLWERNSGILNVDLMDLMPQALKAEVFYDVNKFVLDQLPLLEGLEASFLMSVSVQVKHRYCMSGEVLFRRNETALAMYYVVKGHLEVLTEDEQYAITAIRSGSAIGELHLLQPYLHVATVRCGSDCEIRTLSRKDFKQVLNLYPQYIPLLLQHLENRLEQCGLLLALCEKHNTYHQSFDRLRQFQQDRGSTDFHLSDFSHSFENVAKILQPGVHDKMRASQMSYDFDGMTLSGKIENLLSASQSSFSRPEKNKGYEELLEAAYEALENDVARAVALANDLNISRPPLFVTAPETSASTQVTLGFNQQADSENVGVRLFKRLKQPNKGNLDFAWKFVVSSCALLAFFYYPYQFGILYSGNFGIDFLNLDMAAHLLDLVFAMNYVYDMIQIVVTPQRNFESAGDIALYRFKSVYFYVRVFSFIPFEYIIAPIFGIYSGHEFYIFKFNRLIEMHLVFRFIQEFEIRFRLKPIITVTWKFALGIFFVTHVFAVLHAFAIRFEFKTQLKYIHAFYWALVIVTSVGYGDFPSETTIQLWIEVAGLVVGVSFLIYLAAKATAILANGERKRISFQQSFYALEAFMNHRKFPRSLARRVTAYFNLQWGAHQGTLTPSERSIIWDAPKSVKSRVCYAQSYRYVRRIPLFMYAPEHIQNEICIALKYYIIPPREILLHPNEMAKDLYIISKGFVQVILEGKKIAVFTAGRFFGLNGLLHDVNTPYMFKTLTHCQVFCLTHADMMKVANSSPNFLREINLLLGDEADTMAPSRHVRDSDDYSDLPSYPSKEYLDRLLNMELSPGLDEHLKRSKDAWRMKGKSSTKFYLKPNGTGLKWWMIFRLTAAICVTILTLAQVTFNLEYSMRANLEYSMRAITNYSLDIIAWIDILVSMRIAYYGDKNQLVTNPWKMAKHYMKGPFLLDVLASFPADIVVFLYQYKFKGEHDKHMYHVIALFRLNRLLQCYKVFLTNAHLEKTIFKSLSLVMLIEMAPMMFLFVNIATFLSIVTVCGYSHSSQAQPIKCEQDAWIINGLRDLNYHNISNSTGELPSTFQAYLIGMYWVTQSVLSVGYGDVEIGKNDLNQLVAVVVIFVGCLMASYAGGKLTSCIVGEDPKKIELQEKMTLMHDFLEQQRASRNLKRRVRDAYCNAWEKTNGISPTSLFLALPPALKTDVMKQLYGATLKKSPLFENLDAPAIRMLASSLQEIFFPEGEFLMKFGDLCSDVFFIAHGAVVCYNVRGVIMCQLGGGSIIGEIASFFHVHRLYTAIAVKDVNAYIFKKDVFTNFLNLYPQFKFLLQTYSYQHYREAMMGTKKDFGDPNVAISFLNETTGSHWATTSRQTLPSTLHENLSRSPYIDSEESTPTPTLSKRGNAKLTFQSLGVANNFQDLTRVNLKEDVLKGPDDLSNVAWEKWWSVFITFGRMSRDEMGLLHICQEPSEWKILNFTIHPASAVCKWVTLYLVITALSCSITAYEIAFERTTENPLATTAFAIRNAMELFFIIRILGNFHLGYYDETASLITDVKLISRRYMSQVDGFWLDIITTFPFYLFTEAITTHTNAEYVQSLQLLRAVLFVRYIKETDSSLQMKASRVKITKITILLCFVFHFWACAWYLISCEGTTSCDRGSWMQKTLYDLTFTSDKDPNEVPIFPRYLLSLYYVTNAFTATGFAHITARTNIELCLSIMMMFGTVFVIGYLVGEMVQCLASQVASKIHYQHKITVLENHFAYLGISNDKILKVREYFKLLWYRCKGVMLYDLVEELPYSLRADVATEVYSPNIKSSRLLGKLDENLVRQICAQIRHEIYFPGSQIILAGDLCTSMYFIKKGEVAVLDGNSNLDLCVEILYENECFGEIKVLLPKEQYRFSYIARIESEVGVLHKKDLEAVLENHPRLLAELRYKAGKVKAKRHSKEEEEKVNMYQSIQSIASNQQLEKKQN